MRNSHKVSEGNQAKGARICNLHEGALALLDPKHGGTGIGIADAAIADSLRRKLEGTIPEISPQTRVALFEAAWKFSRLPELCDIVVMLLETWPGRLPHEVAGAVHKFPEKAFAQMPKFVKWKQTTVFEFFFLHLTLFTKVLRGCTGAFSADASITC